MLQDRDFTVAIDRSGSMSLANGNMTRWESCREGTIALAKKAAQFDPDGLTLLLFGSSVKQFDDVTADKVDEIFQEFEPMGGTNLTAALEVFFANYFEKKKTGKTKPNGDIAIFVTDGAPDNTDTVIKSIVEATQKMEKDEELGITFVQVGNDAGATKFLQFLDDELQNKGAKFDIVDTIKLTDCENIPLKEVLERAISD